MARSLKRGRKKRRSATSQKYGAGVPNMYWWLKRKVEGQKGKGFKNVDKVMLKLGMAIAKGMGLKGKKF